MESVMETNTDAGVVGSSDGAGTIL